MINRTVFPHRQFVVALVLDWAIIAITIWLAGYVNNLLFYGLAIFIIGIRQHALGVLGHEGVHNLISKNRKINDGIANIFCAWPISFNVESFRALHIEHHKHLGTENDSELQYLTNFDVPTNKLKVLRIFLLNFCGLGFLKVLKFLYIFRPTTLKSSIGPILTTFTFFAVGFYTNQLWIPLIWYLSLATSFWAVFNVRPWFEHIGVENEDNSLTQRFKPSLLEQFIFFPHNFWLHYEHHKWPNVPFYDLPLKRVADNTIPVLTTMEVLNKLCNSPTQQLITSGNNSKPSEVQLTSVKAN
ncbi:fatty acid desaturase family protein [Nostocales cyanobacterium LEGE 12452]|nr:fatty acid desaturase family protein [Nostocales cyanobacterium LEGE 12452]